MRLTVDHSTAAGCVSVPCYVCRTMTRLSDVVSDLDGPAFEAYYCPSCVPIGATIAPCATSGCARPHPTYDLHDLAVAAGIPVDHHESDLFLKVTPASTALIARYVHRSSVRQFTSQIDRERWYDVPLAYSPFWRTVTARAR